MKRHGTGSGQFREIDTEGRSCAECEATLNDIIHFRILEMELD